MVQGKLTPKQVNDFQDFFSRCSQSQQQALWNLLYEVEASTVEFQVLALKSGGGVKSFTLKTETNHIIELQKGRVSLTDSFRLYLEEKNEYLHRMARGEILDSRGNPIFNLLELC